MFIDHCMCYQDGDPCVLDVIDKACPLVLEKVLPHLPGPDKVGFTCVLCLISSIAGEKQYFAS